MRSVTNIQKITKAMKMVAASKLRIAQAATFESRGILDPLVKLLGDLPGNSLRRDSHLPNFSVHSIPAAIDSLPKLYFHTWSLLCRCRCGEECYRPHLLRQGTVRRHQFFGHKIRKGHCKDMRRRYEFAPWLNLTQEKALSLQNSKLVAMLFCILFCSCLWLERRWTVG